MALTKGDEITLVNAINKICGDQLALLTTRAIALISDHVVNGIGEEGDTPGFRGVELPRILEVNEIRALTQATKSEAGKIWQKYTKGIDLGFQFHTLAEQTPRSVNDAYFSGDPVNVPDNELIEKAFAPLEKEVYITCGPVRVGFTWD
jgi:hypothetical protein